MKITNETHWRTDQLKAILARVAKDELDAFRRRRLNVRIIYRRSLGRDSSTGYAWYHSNSMVIRVPRRQTPDSVDFALTAAHEMAHTRGMRHRDMHGPRYDYGNSGYREVYAWAATYPIEARKPREKREVPAEVVVLKEYERAKAKAAEWTRKLATARRMARGWKAKVRYYDKKAAALRAAKETRS